MCHCLLAGALCAGQQVEGEVGAWVVSLGVSQGWEREMGSYALRRLLVALLLILVVTSITFGILRLLPGDPVDLLLASGESAAGAAPEVAAAMRHTLGLDKPILVQYVDWWAGLLRGDFGRSLNDNRPIAADILKRLPRTLELFVLGILLGMLLGIPAGVTAALNRGRVLDHVSSFIAAFGISAPSYVVGTLFVLVFGLMLRWFPASGYRPFLTSPWEHIRQAALPVLAIALNQAALIARMTRSSMLEVLNSEYVRTGRAKGLAEPTVIRRHALRNALIPVVSVIGVSAGSLLGGTVLIEYVFNWPGLSTLLIQGIYQRDYPMVQGVLLVTSTMFVLLNLGIDMLYGFFDPRIRYN